MPTSRLRVTCLCMALVVVGCSDEEQDKSAATSQPAASSSSLPEKRWMDIDSRLTPAQWLVSQGLTEPKPINDPDVRKAAATLAETNRLYRESERMIANRTVQLEQMLREIGVEDEGAILILTDLTHIAGEVGQTEGFGALSQQYFNIRASRIEREPALAELRARYGRRK